MPATKAAATTTTAPIGFKLIAKFNAYCATVAMLIDPPRAT